MHDRLSDLLIKKEFPQAIQLAKEILLQNPKEIFARYHLGIAHYLNGNRLEGLREIRTIFNDHYQTLFNSEETTQIQRLGFCAIQFAQLSELFLIRGNQELAMNFDLGTRIALEAGKQTGHAPLTQLAQILRKRIHYGHNTDSDDKITYIRPDSPAILQVEPTNHCNLKCVMCPRNEMTRTTGSLSPEVWETILNTWQNVHRHLVHPFIYQNEDLSFETRTPGLIKLFFMGEPLLHKKMGDLIRTAHAKGCVLTIQTNGTLLSFAKVRKTLLESGIDQLAISIDGLDAATYTSIRHGSQFEPLLAGLQAFHQERQAAGLEKKLPICISTIIPPDMPDNELHAQPLFQLLQPYVDHFLTIQLGRRNTTRFLDANGQVVDQSRAMASALTTNRTDQCQDPLYKMNLLWNGVATPCCYDIDGQLALGHVMTDGGVDALWQSQTMRTIQQHAILNTQTHPLCRECLA